MLLFCPQVASLNQNSATLQHALYKHDVFFCAKPSSYSSKKMLMRTILISNFLPHHAHFIGKRPHHQTAHKILPMISVRRIASQVHTRGSRFISNLGFLGRRLIANKALNAKSPSHKMPRNEGTRIAALIKRFNKLGDSTKD